MVPASASALMAVSDRPLAERPEAKGPDASDGRFAGLMAQFVPAPAPTETPNPAQAKPSQEGPANIERAERGEKAEKVEKIERAEKEPPVNPSEAQAPVPPPLSAPANPPGPVSPASEAPVGIPEAPQVAPVAKPEPTQGIQLLVSAPAGAETETKAGKAPSSPSTTLPDSMPRPLPMAPTQTQMRATTPPTTEPEALPLPVGASPKAEIPLPGLPVVAAEPTAGSNPTAALSSTTLAMGKGPERIGAVAAVQRETPSRGQTTSTAPANPEAAPAPRPGVPQTLTQSAATTISVPADPAATPIPRPEVPPLPIPTPATSDSVHVPAPIVAQAVLAESSARLKETPKPDPQAFSSQPVKADPTPSVSKATHEVPSAGPQAEVSLPTPSPQVDSPLPGVKPFKETPRPERMLGAPDASPVDAPQPALKAGRVAEAQAPTWPSSPSQVEPPWHAAPANIPVPAPKSPASTGGEPVLAPARTTSIPAKTDSNPARTGSASVKTDSHPPKTDSIPAKTDSTPTKTDSTPAKTDSTPARPDAASMAPEIPVAKGTLPIPAPVSHGTDGSPLAALGALPRAAATFQALVPHPPLAAAPPPSAPMVQVEGGLRWMLKGGTQEAQLQLHPESLGQVTIHLKVEGGEVHARLWITEAASVKAVQEGRPHLELALKEQGLQLGSFDLQQGHRPFREAPSPPPFREHAAPDAPPARQEAPAAAPPSILNPHRVELYA